MAHINLQKIVSVKGQSGLFHLVNYNPKGYFLQPFDEGPVRFVSNEKGKVLAVGNVDLKLTDGSLNLLDLFLKMGEQEVPVPSITDDEVESYFKNLIPELDESVAPSHLRKVFSWYHAIFAHYQTHELVNEEDDGLSII